MKFRALLLVGIPMLTAGVPAASPGAPASSADRVRAFAATPDWTGLWETEAATLLATDEGIKQLVTAALRSAPGAGKPPPATRDSTVDALNPVDRAIFNSVQLLREPPYNLQWERQYREALEVHGGRALPKVCSISFPLIMESPDGALGMFEALVTPEEVLLAFDTGSVRHIYTDGRPHPKKVDLWPTDMGDSIGHWEGRTLVIDTIERKPGPVMPEAPMPTADLSEQAHFVERLRRVGRDTLIDDMTIEDPQRLAGPWHVSIRYKRVHDVDRLIGGAPCENDRNPRVDGHLTIAPP